MSLQWWHRHYHLDSPILNGVCWQLCYKKLDDLKKRNYWYPLNYSELNWRLCVFLSTGLVIKFLVDMELYVFLHDLAIITSLLLLILFRMDVFGAAHGWDSMQNDPLLREICPSSVRDISYLPQKRLKIYINHLTHTLSSVDISILFTRIQAFFFIIIFFRFIKL